MADGKRLTIVTPTFFPELIGTPHYATDMAKWFVEHRWTVRVVTSQPYYPAFERYEGYGRHRRRDRLGDIEIVRLPTIIPVGGRLRWRALNEANFAVQGMLRAGLGLRDDAVLTVSPGTPWAALVGRAMRRSGGRHVVLVHDVQSGLAGALGASPAVAALARRSERFALARADRIAVLTEEMGSVLTALGLDVPIDVVEIWATVPRPSDSTLSSLSSTVQYSGNFGEKQGIWTLIALAKAMMAEAPSARLLLRGSGVRFDAVQLEVARAGLTNVDFEPPVPAEILPAALARSSIHVAVQAAGTAGHVMPSKVINALASGAYVLATSDAGSALDRLAPATTGLECFRPTDITGMARRIRQLFDDGVDGAERRRIADAAHDSFSRDVLISKLEAALLDDVDATR